MQEDLRLRDFPLILARGGLDDDFIHDADVGDREASAGLAELLGDGGNVLVWIAAGADKANDGADAGIEGGHAVGPLGLRDDHERARFAVETTVADVSDDPDDLAGRLFKLRANAFADDDLLADGIALGPILFGHRLIDLRAPCVRSDRL